jgi:hypothetical protein
MPRRPLTTRALLVLACTGALVAGLASPPVSGARGLSAEADPGALAGAWKRVLTQADIDRTASFREEPSGWQAPLTGPYTLVLANGSFSVRDKTGFAVAETTRVDSGGAFDVLAYIAPDVGAFCPQWIPQNASYTWALEGSELVLAATDDRCADRSSILAGRWAHGSNARTMVARQTSSKKRTKSLTYTEKLTEGGAPVGTDSATCTLSSGKRADCRLTLHLLDGTLSLRGKGDLSKPVFKLTIVGGTGAYAGAKGAATSKGPGTKKSLLTLQLA